MRLLETCPVCRSEKLNEAYQHKDELGLRTWSVWACSNCAMGFVNPQPSWDELAPYYASDYDPYTQSHGATESDEAVVARARAAGEFRHVPIKAGDRLLDVGCGGGYFLRIAGKLGAVPDGVEPSPNGAAASRQAGLNVFHGTLEQYVEAHGDRRFDVITMNHVLEHVPDPVATLSNLRKLLAPGGFVSIIVPNAGCWAVRSMKGDWHSSDVPRHLFQFTERGMEACGRQAGLRRIAFQTYCYPPATAATLRAWLRRRFFFPQRISMRLGFIEKVVAPRLGAWLDRRNGGEALIMRFAV